LLDGRVLFIGGNRWPNLAPTTTVFIYDPASGEVQRAPDMITARVGSGHAVTVLANGDVLVVGGEDPANEVVSQASGLYARLQSAEILVGPDPGITRIPAGVHATGHLWFQLRRGIDLDEGVVTGLAGEWDISFYSPAEDPDVLSVSYTGSNSGAKMAVVGTESVGLDGCSEIALSTLEIETDDLPPGTYICILTNQGRYAELQVHGFDRGKLRTSYTTWE